MHMYVCVSWGQKFSFLEDFANTLDRLSLIGLCFHFNKTFFDGKINILMAYRN